MRTYVLIGGAGVFATHTAKYLLERPETGKVICVGRNIPRGDHYTLGVGRGDPRYSYEQIHMVFEQDRLAKLFDHEEPDVVINFAALAYATSWENSHRFYDTNLTAVARMCEFLAGRDYLRKFVQIGTSELYGSVDRPVNEAAPLKPTSPYAVSKMAADLHLGTMFDAMRFPMNIIRPSNASGPGQQVWRVLPRAVLCGLTGQKLPLQGGGTVEKSYFHAADLARAIQLVADEAPPGRTYNVGPEAPVTISHLLELVADEMGVPFDDLCAPAPARSGEDQRYWLDSSRIRDELGWRPEIDLRAGVRDVVAWGVQHLDALRAEATEFVLRA